MILSTTPTLDGARILEYKKIVIGETVIGINFFRDFLAGFTDFFGGRSGSYEKSIVEARDFAFNEMIEKAKSIGANAIVGIVIDYESVGAKNKGMLMVTCSGTAVTVTL